MTPYFKEQLGCEGSMRQHDTQLRSALYTNPTPAQPAPVVPEGWIDGVLREVAELPDRTSPEDEPDMMLVTADELRSILLAATPTPLAQAAQQGSE